jgi:hypothetical protein
MKKRWMLGASSKRMVTAEAFIQTCPGVTGQELLTEIRLF